MSRTCDGSTAYLSAVPWESLLGRSAETSKGNSSPAGPWELRAPPSEYEWVSEYEGHARAPELRMSVGRTGPSASCKDCPMAMKRSTAKRERVVKEPLEKAKEKSMETAERVKRRETSERVKRRETSV